jgi:hypothetical protein
LSLVKGKGAMSWNETIDNYLYDEILDIYKYLHRYFAQMIPAQRNRILLMLCYQNMS